MHGCSRSELCDSKEITMDTSTTAVARCNDHALLHERTQAWSSLVSPRPYLWFLVSDDYETLVVWVTIHVKRLLVHIIITLYTRPRSIHGLSTVDHPTIKKLDVTDDVAKIWSSQFERIQHGLCFAFFISRNVDVCHTIYHYLGKQIVSGKVSHIENIRAEIFRAIYSVEGGRK